MQSAPSQISPGESFDLFYFIRNHTDATTYYVRARIYDVRTGALLDTQDLAQSSTNARLFIKTATAPVDPPGYGRSIVSIASVYTDSGYTTKSENYEEQEQYFLVKTLAPLGGGGGSIELPDFRKIIDEALTEKLAPLMDLEPLTFPEMPFDALFGAIGALQREVNRIPKDLVDLSALDAGLDAVRELIEGRPKFEKTDLTSVQAAVSKLDTLASTLRDGQSKSSAATSAAFKSAVQELKDLITENLGKSVEKVISTKELTIPLSDLFTNKPEKLADVSHLY